MTLDQEVKKDNKVVSGWLLYYHERKQSYNQRREAILYGSARPKDSGVPGSPYISDTTARKAEKLATLDEETGVWLVLVEEVQRRLPWKLQILLRLKQKYRTGVRGRPVRWIIALELSEEVSRRTRKDYSVGPDAVDEWWNKVVDYAGRLAAKKKLL